jgi:Ca2+-binding RTX toxin-like protein
VRELDARLPIADRGVLAIAGASGPIQAEGVMDSDYDGDATGIGRRTRASRTSTPTPRRAPPSRATPATAPVPAARTDGVITALRLRSASAAPLTLQTLRPNDTLSPGAGHDAIDAGAGNDTINAVDGVRETVDCGSGRDTVRADRRDRLRHCEKATRRR